MFLDMEFKLNIDFYTYCKRLNSNNFRIYSSYNTLKGQKGLRLIINNFKELIDEQKSFGTFIEQLEKIVLSHNDAPKFINILDEYRRLFFDWNDYIYPKLFVTALEFISYKDKLLEIIKERSTQAINVDHLHLLSLKYDNISSIKPYASRVANITIINEFLSSNYITYHDELIDKKVGIQGILLNVLGESVNQSITSSAGKDYEDRIYTYLTEILLLPEDAIERLHHSETGSIEHDFKFQYNGKIFSISAKKTFRERYKQYINLINQVANIELSEFDVVEQEILTRYQSQAKEQLIRDLGANILLTITLGTDLTENKARTIRTFGVYIFVSEEVYLEKTYLQTMVGVYSVASLNQELLLTLSNNE